MSLSARIDRTKLTAEQLQHAIDANLPLQAPPDGVIPNFGSGDTTAYQIYITAGVCVPLMTVFSLFRLLHAIKFRRKTFVTDESVSPYLFRTNKRR